MQTTSPPFPGLQLLLLAAFLAIAVLFLLTEQNTLKQIRAENRLMQPGLVWLQLIPLFGQFWQFLVVIRISGSIKQEMEAGNEDSILGFADPVAVEMSGKRPTYSIGIVYCILNVVGILLSLLTRERSSTLVGTISLAGMICWIIYWVQLAGCKRQLKRTRLATQ